MKIKQLMERYNLKTRQALYNRLHHLGLSLDKDSSGANSATPEQIELLDQLHDHLKSGAVMDSFTPLSSTALDSSIDSSIDSSLSHSVESPVDTQLSLGDTSPLLAVVEAIAAKLQPSSPLWFHAELERAHDSGWLLTTSEVRQLIGVKPVCPAGVNFYQRGCWLFEKAGKIGGQTAAARPQKV